MRMNQKGFGLIEGLLIAILIAVLAFGSYYIWNENQSDDDSDDVATEQTSNDSDTNTTTDSEDNTNSTEISETPETPDPYAGWTQATLPSINLTAQIPDDWTDKSDPDAFADGSWAYEEVIVESANGFRLSMRASNLPRGFAGVTEQTVLAAGPIAGPTGSAQYVVTENEDGTITFIMARSGASSVGDMILPIAIIDTGIDGGQDGNIRLEIDGSYTGESAPSFIEIEDFLANEDVQDAILVLESIRFDES